MSSQSFIGAILHQRNAKTTAFQAISLDQTGDVQAKRRGSDSVSIVAGAVSQPARAYLSSSAAFDAAPTARGRMRNTMYIILLKFSNNRENAAQYLSGHKKWLSDGIEDGSFLMAGTIGPGVGGAILAQGGSLEKIVDRVNDDPFVRADVVTAEVLEYTPSLAGEEFQFLLAREANGQRCP